MQVPLIVLSAYKNSMRPELGTMPICFQLGAFICAEPWIGESDDIIDGTVTIRLSNQAEYRITSEAWRAFAAILGNLKLGTIFDPPELQSEYPRIRH